jgi:hypothetical protein
MKIEPPSWLILFSTGKAMNGAVADAVLLMDFGILEGHAELAILQQLREAPLPIRHVLVRNACQSVTELAKYEDVAGRINDLRVSQVVQKFADAAVAVHVLDHEHDYTACILSFSLQKRRRCQRRFFIRDRGVNYSLSWYA